MLLTFQQRLYPEWAQTRRRGCVKLGVPGNLGATSCVSRRVSERRTPWVPQRVILGVLRSNEKKTNSRTTHSEIKKMKKKIKIGERKKSSHSRYGNTTHYPDITKREDKRYVSTAYLPVRQRRTRGFGTARQALRTPAIILTALCHPVR